VIYVTGWSTHKFTMASIGVALLHQASNQVEW